MLRFSARIVIFLCAVSGGSVWAHPGAGIVVNSQGRIYFVLYGPVNRTGRCTIPTQQPRCKG